MICQRTQNVFFCGGKNPLKYIPMWFPIGFSLTLIYQYVLIPCGKLKETFAQNPPFIPIKYSWVFAAHIFVVTCTHCESLCRHLFIYMSVHHL